MMRKNILASGMAACHRIGRQRCWMGIVAATVQMIAGGPAASQSVEEFYKGKTIRLIVGYSAGGGHDAYARLLARFIGRYIPGNPRLVVENMPGASTVRA